MQDAELRTIIIEKLKKKGIPHQDWEKWIMAVRVYNRALELLEEERTDSWKH